MQFLSSDRRVLESTLLKNVSYVLGTVFTFLAPSLLLLLLLSLRDLLYECRDLWF